MIRWSKLAWSNSVLCIPFTLSGRPNECLLHTCDACVITTLRLGLRTPLVACNNDKKEKKRKNRFITIPFLSTSDLNQKMHVLKQTCWYSHRWPRLCGSSGSPQSQGCRWYSRAHQVLVTEIWQQRCPSYLKHSSCFLYVTATSFYADILFVSHFFLQFRC